MPFGWHDGGWGVVWMILSWALVAAIIVLVVRAFSSGSARSEKHSGDPARTILDERFARGEISEEEHRERRRVLDDAQH